MFELSQHLKHFSRCVSAASRPCLLGSSSFDLTLMPKRTTFILKRKYPVRLPKIGETSWRLKGKDYVYDLVQDTDSVKKPDVSIVLKRYIDGIGNEGDVVVVPRTKAYTEFIVTGFADFATPEVVKAAETRRAQVVEDDAARASSRYAPL